MRKLSTTLLLIFLSLSCIKEKETGADLVIGDRIPDFTVTMNDGSTVSGEQLREGVSCIVFFTTLCPDCQQTLPHVQKIYDEYLSQGVKFALISREESRESIERYWAENGYTMPYSAQKDRLIYELFAKTRVPRVYISRGGVIKTIFTDSPNPSYTDLDSSIQGALIKY